MAIDGNLRSATVGTWGADATLAVAVGSGGDDTFFDGNEVGTGGKLSTLRIDDYETDGDDLFGVTADDFGTILVGRLRIPKEGLPYEDGDFRMVMV